MSCLQTLLTDTVKPSIVVLMRRDWQDQSHILLFFLPSNIYTVWGGAKAAHLWCLNHNNICYLLQLFSVRGEAVRGNN